MTKSQINFKKIKSQNIFGVLRFSFLLGFAIWALGFGSASAYTIEKLNFSNEGDIVVGPGKTELWLDPGGSSTQEMVVSNRSGVPKIINISVEDFEGTSNPEETIQFLNDKTSPYSLKNFVKPEVNQITLQFGERLRLPVVVNIPAGTEPGGLYGAVMISASNVPEPGASIASNTAAGKVKVITRVASLFFVRINGKANEAGQLSGFKALKSFYEAGPVDFQIALKNEGSVHLSPYGTIEVKNILGQKVDEREVDPWFVMPKSERTREIKWNSNFLFGRYTATLFMNRGYGDIIDQKSFSFWVIPWRLVSMILIGLILVIWFIIWIASHFELKKKQ